MKTTRPQGAAPKRPRGRPRKTAVVDMQAGALTVRQEEYQERVAAAKRPRGRPRKNALVPKEWQQADAPPPAMPLSDTQALISAITSASRDPKVDIAKMDWLLRTRTAIMEDEARVSYNDAMARVQGKLEPVRRAARNPQTSSKYATEAALDDAIRPYYSEQGFALEFDTEPIPERDERWVMIVCYCSRGRERRRHQIPMPCDGLGPKGSPVMSRTHAVASAFSYGRRYLRCGIFNVITADMAKQDDDGNAAGRYQAPPSGNKWREDVPEGLQEAPREEPVTIENEPPANPIGRGQLAALRAVMERAKVPESVVLEKFNVATLEDLTDAQFITARNKCNATLKARNTPEDLPKEATNGESSRLES